ncbi:unnamed protein product [Heterosigma akashiwo]
MGFCRSFCKIIFSSLLFILNLVDCISGVLLVLYGYYTYQTFKEEAGDQNIQFTFISVFVLGGLLTLSSIFSFIGISADSCRCGLVVSAWFTIPVAMVEFIFAVVFASCKNRVYRFISEEQEMLHLSDSSVQFFKMWYRMIVWALFVLFSLQLLRFQLSKSLREKIQMDIHEYHRLIDVEEQEEQQRMLQTKLLLEEKYDGLRDHYRNKYSSSGQVANHNNNNNGQQTEEGNKFGGKGSAPGGVIV